MVEYEVLPEDFLARFLPRNLSYSEESYLDNFSTCAPYVTISPSKDLINYIRSKQREQSDLLCADFGSMFETSCADPGLRLISPPKMTDLEGTSVDPPTPTKENGDINEVLSEEGIFVNSMDDLDGVEPATRRDSDGSDPTYFSMDSPEEQQEIVPQNHEALAKAVSTELLKNDLKQNFSDSAIPSKPGPDAQDVSNIKKNNSADSFEVKFAQLKLEMTSGQSITGTGTRKYLLPVPDSPVYDDPEFNFNRSELRKSSSLKSNKTPPGTPARKKMVRFADVMGLDLENIRHVLDAENPPRIPPSAIADLKVGVEVERRTVGSRYLDLCFQQPCAHELFMRRVMANKVSLENCVITDMSITGVVRVANIGYHKCVRVRYSVNDWVTFYDVMASYVQNSYDGVTDRFAFTIVSPATLGPGSKISFAVSYTVNDTVYWDSNYSKNYDVSCYAKTTPTDLGAGWVHFV